MKFLPNERFLLNEIEIYELIDVFSWLSDDIQYRF